MKSAETLTGTEKNKNKKKVSATTIKKLRKTYIIPQSAGHKTQPDFS